MKSISITSIICGTALILAPIVHDMLLTSSMARILETTRERASITSTLSVSYNTWCLVIGAGIIVAGLVLGTRRPRTADDRSPLTAASVSRATSGNG